MLKWKRVVTLSAVYLSVALFAFAAGAGRGKERKAEGRVAKGGGRGSVATLVAKFVAKDVGLAADKADSFATAYVADREAASKRAAEAAKSGDKTQRKAAAEDLRTSLDKFLDGNLTAEQAKKAKAYDLPSLERSVALLISAPVEEAKVEQALPVLANYHKSAAELMTKARAKEIARADAQAKETELRTSAAKDLSPIVGEAVAKKWEESRAAQAPMGKAGKEAGAGAGKPRGAGGGKRRGGDTTPATPVAPVAP